jgi:uncharacterized protein (DUF433 family)
VDQEKIDLLARPVYGMVQVDRILQLPPGTARRWIDGYIRDGKRYQPVVRLESTGEDVVTWGEFTETRLLSEFRGAGVPMARMRPAVNRLREMFDEHYPLAHALPWLDTNGRELVLQVQHEVDLESRLRFVVVRNEQLVLTLPADRFVRSVEWDDHGAARRLHPLPELDHVFLDPLRQFGEPVVRSVPTAVIAEQVRAGDRIAMIAELYELAEDEVEQAIRYELLRGREAQRAA